MYRPRACDTFVRTPQSIQSLLVLYITRTSPDDKTSANVSTKYHAGTVTRTALQKQAQRLELGYTIFTPLPVGDGVLFSGDFFLSLFFCQQHYEKTAGPICMKFSGKVWSDHGTWPDDLIQFLVNSGKRVGGSKDSFFVITGHSSEDWRCVNKSVSFARWQQGAEFVVPRTTACLV